MKTSHLTAVLLVLSAASLFVGVTDLTLRDIFNLTELKAQIFWASRVPRLISILTAGAGLSIAGLIMQQLSSNKFVSPTTAGTMDAARLGVLATYLWFSSSGMLGRMAVALAFALLGTFGFLKILDRIRYKSAVFIPLIGLMYGNIIGAVTTFFAYKHNLIQNLAAWLHGDFSMIIRGRYELLYLTIPAMAAAWLYASRFTIAGMGEDFATNLGLNHQQVVRIGLVIVAVVAAAVVVTVGSLPFLGLVVPNVVSLYLGDNLRKTLVHTALLGAAFVLACDLLGRVIIFPYEIPIGLTVGVIGSAAFLYLVVKQYAPAA